MSEPIGTDEMLDRIELLAATNKELEAKLEKAVAIAKDAIETMECGPFFPDQESQRLLADLAAVTGPHKLTGGKDE